MEKWPKICWFDMEWPSNRLKSTANLCHLLVWVMRHGWADAGSPAAAGGIYTEHDFAVRATLASTRLFWRFVMILIDFLVKFQYFVSFMTDKINWNIHSPGGRPVQIFYSSPRFPVASVEGASVTGVIPDRREPYRRVPLGRVHLDERRLDEVQ